MKKLISLSNFERYVVPVEGKIHFIPSDRMLKEVLLSLPTIAEQEELCLDSNYYVTHIINDSIDKTTEEELKIWECICLRLGKSFQQFYKAGITIKWYASLIDTKTCSPRLEYDFFNWYSDTFEKRLKDEFFCRFYKKLPIDEPLTRFKEYHQADLFIGGVFNETLEKAKNDESLASKLCSWIELKKNVSYERYRNNDLEFAVTQCLQCKQLFLYPLGQGISQQPPHCENESCRKKYQRSKPSKQNRGAKSDWEATENKRKRCKSCTKIRLLNADRDCKECYLEVTPEIL